MITTNTNQLEDLRERVDLRAQGWRDRFVELLNQTDKMPTDIWAVFREVDAWLAGGECRHENKVRVIRPLSDGRPQQRWQCTGCGWISNPIPSVNGQEWPLYVDINKYLGIARDEMREYAQSMSDVARGIRTKAWWLWYNRYLQTPEWKTRRSMVLERDHYICQAKMAGCMMRANQAHHLTYDHVGNEPLFELVSVCESCHQQLTEADRGRQSLA